MKKNNKIIGGTNYFTVISHKKCKSVTRAPIESAVHSFT